MVDRIGGGSDLAKAAIEAALRRHSEALRNAASTQGATDTAAKPSSFSTTLSQGLEQLNSSVGVADQLPFDVLSGKVTDFHEVAAQLKQSELSLKFAMEVRNKFVDAYREIMRMSV